MRAGATSMFTGSGPGYGGPPSAPQGTARTQSDPWGKVRKFDIYGILTVLITRKDLQLQATS